MRPPIAEPVPQPEIPHAWPPAPPAPPPELLLSGPAVQGGCIIGKAPWPRAPVRVDAELVGLTSRDGYFVVGFDRDAPATATLDIGDGRLIQSITVSPGDFDIQRVNGLPQDTVTPEAPEILAKIAAEAERKAAGFASQWDADWFKDGFVTPLAYTRVSGRFGGQRILNGTPARPHYGADLAAPRGTPVHAPCDGVVSFAETGLHYEGGLIMIDHGQGLVTAYLHLSKVEVEKGQTLRTGQKIGEVGAEGRATGPHLCWRMKWRGRNLDPTLLVGVQAPKN
jgi:murein DD-endopeptidase MepM/ murein hydrolase activator NlpD